MNGDPVFVGLAAFEINGVAANPAEITLVELILFQITSSTQHG